MHADIILIRTVFTIILVTAGYLIQPVPDWVGDKLGIPGGSRTLSALAGLLLASGIILFELRIRRASLKTLATHLVQAQRLTVLINARPRGRL